MEGPQVGGCEYTREPATKETEILDMAALALLILAIAAAARLVGSDRSLLPWLW